MGVHDTALRLISAFSAPLRFKCLSSSPSVSPWFKCFVLASWRFNFRFRVCAPFIVSLGLILFSGCVPAQVPDNLDDTPGPPVVVSEDRYQGAVFSARAPAGWRIITSESRVPQAADVTVIGQRNTIQEIELADGKIVTSVLSAPDDQWATFEPVFEWVRGSVQISTPAN